jgi:putative membrane protein insertion efficiency factor
MKKAIVAGIKFYQKWISPVFTARCKYYPSCSSYAVSAISSHGLRGVGISLWRLVRCNPWSNGGVDYPVKNNAKTFINQPKTTVGVN